jgi:hypothetical protein
MAEKHQEMQQTTTPPETPEQKQAKADEEYKKPFVEKAHHITLIRDVLIRAGLDNQYVDVVATLLLTANK